MRLPLWINNLRTVLFRKNKNKQYMNDDNPTEENIYGYKTKKEFSRLNWLLHDIIKYKILVPVSLIASILFKPWMNRPIPDGAHNTLIKIFDIAFEESIRDWTVLYFMQKQRMNSELKGKKVDADELIGKWTEWSKTSLTCKVLRIFKKILIIGYLFDPVYREFITFVMHRITSNMLKEYGGKKSNKHVFYNQNSAYNMEYYMVYHKFKTEVTPFAVKHGDQFLSGKPDEQKKDNRK